MDFLVIADRAPRTRSKALSALRRFCQWAVDEGHLRRNPARAMERPTVVAVAPTELSDTQRFVLKTMVERHATLRFAAIFALGYWAGLRISEIAALRLDQCAINQRAGSITLVDGKGGKTRTLDLHNMARRALYYYLSPAEPRDDDRDPESVYVFTSQRAAWLRQSGRPDHLSERGISDFSDLDQLAERLMAYVSEWNVSAHPFNWATKSAVKVMTKYQTQKLHVSAV